MSLVIKFKSIIQVLSIFKDVYPSPAYLDDEDEIFGNGIKFSHPTGTLLPVKKATVNCKVHNKLSSTHTLIGSLL